MNDKSIDITKARQDLKNLGIRSELWLGQNKNGKCSKPHAKYSFTSDNRKKFCQFIKGVKLPDRSIGKRSIIRLDQQELKKVIWYVLHKSHEIDTYRAKFKSHGQSTDVEAPPDIIDVDEDDDFIDDKDDVPQDLANSNDEVLVNDDDDDVLCERPKTQQGGRQGRQGCRLGTHGETKNLGLRKTIGFFSPTGCVMWQASNPDLSITSSRKSGISILTIGLTLSKLPEAFKMLKTRQRERSSASRDPSHLLSSEINREFRDQHTVTVLSILTFFDHHHTQWGKFAAARTRRLTIAEFIMVLAGQGRDAIFINEPRCTHTNADVNEVKEDNKRLKKELAMSVRTDISGMI
ncbi:hypothetical protein Tco_0058113 [Tanacetum coccineum]